MIRTFRPWQIFEKLGDDNKLNVTIPTVPGTTSRTVFMLETALLIAAARIVKAKTILEVGTCMGYTAMHLAMNTDATRITSVDIAPKLPLVWQTDKLESCKGVNLFTGTIQQYAEKHKDHFDMIFIDASHNYQDVKADTETALRFNPKVIVWHDFMNPMEPGTQKFLSEFAQDHNLIHVQDSWLCFWFKGDL